MATTRPSVGLTPCAQLGLTTTPSVPKKLIQIGRFQSHEAESYWSLIGVFFGLMEATAVPCSLTLLHLLPKPLHDSHAQRWE